VRCWYCVGLEPSAATRAYSSPRTNTSTGPDSSPRANAHPEVYACEPELVRDGRLRAQQPSLRRVLGLSRLLCAVSSSDAGACAPTPPGASTPAITATPAIAVALAIARELPLLVRASRCLRGLPVLLQRLLRWVAKPKPIAEPVAEPIAKPFARELQLLVRTSL